MPVLPPVPQVAQPCPECTLQTGPVHVGKGYLHTWSSVPFEFFRDVFVRRCKTSKLSLRHIHFSPVMLPDDLSGISTSAPIRPDPPAAHPSSGGQLGIEP